MHTIVHAIVMSEGSRVKTVTVTSNLNKLKEEFSKQCTTFGLQETYPFAMFPIEMKGSLGTCNIYAIEDCNHIE